LPERVREEPKAESAPTKSVKEKIRKILCMFISMEFESLP
jgi:hypothetical protein